MKEPKPSIRVPTNWAMRFFAIWGGQAFSLFGSGLVQFALVWFLTRQTGSGTVLATATLVAMLPQIVLGPLAGAFVDRHDRRIIMILADGATALATLLLAFLFATDLVQVWHIYVILMIRSLGQAFHYPAMQASTTLLVPDTQLTRISGINQTLMGMITILAPPTGALLLEIMPLQAVLFIDVGTALVAILPLIFIPIPRPERFSPQSQDGEPAPTGFLEDVRAGLRYVAAWPGLLAILVMATVINFLLTPTSALMPLLITKHFGLGALEFGLMDSAWGMGAILGGAILSAWGGFRRKVITSMIGIIGIGLGVTIVGVTPPHMYWMALAGIAFSGIMNPIANGPLFALVQSSVRADMQGRVMSLIISAASAMSPLSLMVAGPVSDLIGINTWFWFGGLVCLLMGAGAFLVPAIMHVEDNHNGGNQPTDTPQPVVISTD